MFRILALAMSLAIASTAPALAWKKIEAIDADTVRLPGGGGLAVITLRLNGIDAPELHSGCEAERHHAQAGRNRLNDLMAPGAEAGTNFNFDRYGRFLGWVTLKDGRNAAEVLVVQAYVRRYDGKGPRRPWCDADGKLTP